MAMKNNFNGIQLDFDDDYSFRRLVDVDIDKIEAELHFTFPKDLREFYKSFNGAQFGESCCIEQKETFQKVHVMAELDAVDRDNDFAELFHATVSEYWPKQLIPFAYDEGGHEFCFSIATDNYGEIYFHDSELSGEQHETRFLAENFLRFLAALRPESDFED
jgi:cell wall assembly regulator SMI1